MSIRTNRRSARVALVAIVTAAAAGLAGCAPGAASTAAETDSAEPKTITITDEVGREIELTVPVKAVYTDLSYQSEVVRAIGAGDAIVAVDGTSDPATSKASSKYFSSWSDAVVVGNDEAPNWEAIVDSGAEVALLRTNSPWEDAVAKLEPFGIDVIVVTTWDPEVLREYIPVLGEVFGVEDQAAEVAKLYDDIDNLLAERLKDVDPVPVYYEGNVDYETTVPGSGFNETIVKAGGENIFSDIDLGPDAATYSFDVDPVSIIERDPALILRNGPSAVGGTFAVSGYDNWPVSDSEATAKGIAERPGWEGITAVQNDEIYVFNNFYYSALGKQFGALALATWLHPEELSDVDLDEYFKRWLDLQGVEYRDVDNYIYKYEG